MSATITIEFEDGRKVQWVTSRERGEMTWIDLNFKVGDCYKELEPLDFSPLNGSKRAIVATTSDFHYIILDDVLEGEVKLYQMPASESICPVNVKRANRFRRFSEECGDEGPLVGLAVVTADDWNAESSGWECE